MVKYCIFSDLFRPVAVVAQKIFKVQTPFYQLEPMAMVSIFGMLEYSCGEPNKFILRSFGTIKEKNSQFIKMYHYDRFYELF